MRKFIPNPSRPWIPPPPVEEPAGQTAAPARGYQPAPTLLLFLIGLVAGAFAYREVSRLYPIPLEAVQWDAEEHVYVWK